MGGGLSLSLSPYVVEVRVAERWYLVLSLALCLSLSLYVSPSVVKMRIAGWSSLSLSV